VYACCTHPVLSGKALERIAQSPIERLCVADTIDLSKRELPSKIGVISTAHLFSEAIARIAHEESISALFPAEPDGAEERQQQRLEPGHAPKQTARTSVRTNAPHRA
jgi:hypothetical protein